MISRILLLRAHSLSLISPAFAAPSLGLISRTSVHRPSFCLFYLCCDQTPTPNPAANYTEPLKTTAGDQTMGVCSFLILFLGKASVFHVLHLGHVFKIDRYCINISVSHSMSFWEQDGLLRNKHKCSHLLLLLPRYFDRRNEPLMAAMNIDQNKIMLPIYKSVLMLGIWK